MIYGMVDNLIMFALDVTSIILAIIVINIYSKTKKKNQKQNEQQLNQPQPPNKQEAEQSGNRENEISTEITREKAEIDNQKKIKPRRNFSPKDKAQFLPNSNWFAAHNIKTKEICIKKRELRNYNYEEKTMLALTTFPRAKTSMIFIPVLFLIGILAIVISFLVSGGIMAIVAGGVVLFGGSFLVQRRAQILEGFYLLEGRKLLKLPIGYAILNHFAYPIGVLWGSFSSFIYIMFDRGKGEKARFLPRIVAPVYMGFDDLIEYYTKYEAECMQQAVQQHWANKKQEEYYEIKKHEQIVREEIANDSSLTFSEKYLETEKLNKKSKEADEFYENEVKPKL